MVLRSRALRARKELRYHPGSDSHGQKFCPHWGSSAWHSRRVHEQRPFTAEASAKHSRKRQLHATHVGAVGWELHRTSPTTCAGKAGSGVTLICVPVAASGKRKTEENLIFHYNFVQCSTVKLLFFVEHFCGNIRIFVATTVLPLSTLCGLLEISKCL